MGISAQILWYSECFPYDGKIETNIDNNTVLFALLLNDKLVAIGSEFTQGGGGVYGKLNMIFNTHSVFDSTLKEQISGKKLFNGSPELWDELYGMIKNKRMLGKYELPEQPIRLLYQTRYNDEGYIIRENIWRQPKRFTMINVTKQRFFHSDNMKEVTGRLSDIVNRQIVLF